MTLARLTLTDADGVYVAVLEGEVDISNADGLARQLEVVPNTALGVVVDLTQTTFLGSSGLELLFRLGARLSAREQRLALAVAEGAPMRRLLELSEITQIAPIAATAAEAVQEIRDEPERLADARS
jgi:anti-anti-sigma factor